MARPKWRVILLGVVLLAGLFLVPFGVSRTCFNCHDSSGDCTGKDALQYGLAAVGAASVVLGILAFILTQSIKMAIISIVLNAVLGDVVVSVLTSSLMCSEAAAEHPKMLIIPFCILVGIVFVQSAVILRGKIMPG